MSPALRIGILSTPLCTSSAPRPPRRRIIPPFPPREALRARFAFRFRHDVLVMKTNEAVMRNLDGHPARIEQTLTTRRLGVLEENIVFPTL